MSKKIELTIDEKWEVCKRYFESCYKDPITKAYIKLKRRPDDVKVQFYFTSMKKLADTKSEYDRAQEEKRNR